MKFKIIYEYYEITDDIDWIELDDERALRFVDNDGANHWIPKYMIKKIIPLDKESQSDEKDN